jgi:hypothetical protein
MNVSGRVVLAFVVAAVIGCNASPKQSQKSLEVTPESPRPALPSVINTGAGTADTFSKQSRRQKIWTVKWQRSRFTPDRQGKQAVANLEGVTGTIYRDGKAIATFKSQNGIVDSAKEYLELAGSVVLTSLKFKATLTADLVSYLESERIVRCSGKIQVVNPDGILELSDPLWATPELDMVGSPEIFKTL